MSPCPSRLVTKEEVGIELIRFQPVLLRLNPKTSDWMIRSRGELWWRCICSDGLEYIICL